MAVLRVYGNGCVFAHIPNLVHCPTLPTVVNAAVSPRSDISGAAQVLFGVVVVTDIHVATVLVNSNGYVLPGIVGRIYCLDKKSG
jgi:hypothetical protein